MSEEKNSKFLNAIERYSKEQQKALKVKYRDLRKKELQKAEAEVLRDAYYYIQEKMVAMHKEIDSKVSKAETESKKILLRKREEIKRSVFDRALEMLIDFKKNDDAYKKLLKNSILSILKVLDYSGTIFYLKPEDIRFSDLIKEEYKKPCTVKESKEIKIGGIICINTKIGISINETLDEKLKNQDLWFITNSGLKVV